MSIDVADWLSGLGLGQYAPAFAANDIDGEVLPELTADDLTGLGITSIGHRRKLLAAIAALRSGAPNPSPRPRPPHRCGRRRGRAAPADGDVLRSGRLDAAVDALRPRGSARDRSAPITAASPTRSAASPVLSPSIWATGCWFISAIREAHEDDAERAVRAGLAVIEAVGRLRRRRRLERAARHRHRARRGRRSDRRGCRAGARGRRRDAEPRRPAAGAWPRRTRWSSPKRRAGRSAGCSISTISGRKRLPALPSRNRPGGSLARAGC